MLLQSNFAMLTSRVQLDTRQLSQQLKVGIERPCLTQGRNGMAEWQNGSGGLVGPIDVGVSVLNFTRTTHSATKQHPHNRITGTHLLLVSPLFYAPPFLSLSSAANRSCSSISLQFRRLSVSRSNTKRTPTLLPTDSPTYNSIQVSSLSEDGQ